MHLSGVGNAPNQDPKRDEMISVCGTAFVSTGKLHHAGTLVLSETRALAPHACSSLVKTALALTEKADIVAGFEKTHIKVMKDVFSLYQIVIFRGAFAGL